MPKDSEEHTDGDPEHVLTEIAELVDALRRLANEIGRALNKSELSPYFHHLDGRLDYLSTESGLVPSEILSASWKLGRNLDGLLESIDLINDVVGSAAPQLQNARDLYKLNRLIFCDVYVSIDDGKSEKHGRGMRRAFLDLVKAAGGVEVWTGREIVGSWFKRSGIATALQADDVKDVVEKIATAVELKLLSQPQSEVDSALSHGVAALIASMADVDQCALRLGSLLLLKVTEGGESKVVSFNLSPVEARRLNSQPELLMNPGEILKTLTEQRATAIPLTGRELDA